MTLFAHNLKLGFEICSFELNCKPLQVQARWYNLLRKKESLFLTGNSVSAHVNTKNVFRNKPRPEYKVNKLKVSLMSGTVTMSRNK